MSAEPTTEFHVLLQTAEPAALGPEARRGRKSVAELEASSCCGMIIWTNPTPWPRTFTTPTAVSFTESCTAANRIMATPSIGSIASARIPPMRKSPGRLLPPRQRRKKKNYWPEFVRVGFGIRFNSSTPARRPAVPHLATVPCCGNGKKLNSPSCCNGSPRNEFSPYFSLAASNALIRPLIVCCRASTAEVSPRAAMALLVSGPIEANLICGWRCSSCGRSKRA